MSKRIPPSPGRARERALFVYASALERGDFDTVAAVLRLAERDVILDQMIKDLDALNSPPEERQAANGLPPSNNKYIQQIVTVSESFPDGQPPEFDHHEEEDSMYITYEPTRTDRSQWFIPRVLTLAAAILILIFIGGLLIEMVNDPIDGYPAIQALQTEEPKCAAESVTDPAAESIRLANAAMLLLQTPDADRTPEMVEQGALLALCAMQTAPTPKADAALQRAMIHLEIVPQLPGHSAELNAAVFSPDGNRLLISSYDGAHLWDIATTSEIRNFPGDNPSRILEAVFSPDGRQILALTEDGIFLWDVETGTTILSGFDTGTFVNHLAYAPDGVHAAFGMVDGSVQIWNLDTPALEQTFQVQGDGIGDLAFSPEGKSLLVGGDRTQNEIYLVNLETGDQRAFVGLRDFSNSVAFSPDGQYVLAGGDTQDRRAVLWATETGEQIHVFSGFINDVNVVTFSPDGQYVLAGSADRTARIFDIESGAEVRGFTGGENYVGSVAFSPDDGKIVLVGIQGGSVRLWPASIEDTVTLACSKMIRDFTTEERAEYGLGEGAACP
jgi:sugar lactone lactonase YvrE